MLCAPTSIQKTLPIINLTFLSFFTDDSVWSDDLLQISAQVNAWFAEHTRADSYWYISISLEAIAGLKRHLNGNCSPGTDGISSEHLHFDSSPILLSVLSGY